MINSIIKNLRYGLLLVALFPACQNDDFRVGLNLVDPSTSTVFVDTATIRLFTIAVDSLKTSAASSSVAFAGTYDDPYLGKVTANSFFEFERATVGNAKKQSVFDSVTLIMKSNGVYYGDTLLPRSLKVHELTQKIEYGDDGAFYSTVRYPLGNELTDARFRMKIGRKPYAEIRLPDEFGKKMFNGILNEEEAYNTTNFINTFPGLSVSTGTGNNCIYGFDSSQDTMIYIQIYYHTNDGIRKEDTMFFTINTGKKFYNMQYEKLPHLQVTSKDDPKPSRETNNTGIIFSGGAPLYARLEFPFLNNFLDIGEIVRIQSATLILRPLRNTYETTPLPEALNLFRMDPTSGSLSTTALAETVGGQSQTLTGNLSTNYPNYEFNITDFISEQLGKGGYDKHALSISIPRGNDGFDPGQLNRLVFGDQQYWYGDSEGLSRASRIQLRITYTVYNKYE